MPDIEPEHAAPAGQTYTRFLMKIQVLMIPIIMKAIPPSAHKFRLQQEKEELWTCL